MVIGMWEVPSMDAATQLDYMKEILQDVCDMFGKGQGEEGTNEIIESIKNVKQGW